MVLLKKFKEIYLKDINFCEPIEQGRLYEHQNPVYC